MIDHADANLRLCEREGGVQWRVSGTCHNRHFAQHPPVHGRGFLIGDHRDFQFFRKCRCGDKREGFAICLKVKSN